MESELITERTVKLLLTAITKEAISEEISSRVVAIHPKS